MAFTEASTPDNKGIFTDLQGAWLCLRNEVLKLSRSPIREQLLAHIAQGMNWESVRDLKKMQSALSRIRQQAEQESLAQEIHFWIHDIQLTLHEIQAGLQPDNNT